ncbi:hypothetical protein P618_200097 [Holospora obtusa F1]|uniref:EF-hand domain-containing protein n=1 Tax=Holospora obtusa F1 TaxID=1399147 RepID=W6TFD8_HOLOB|nr:hypothetical protein [Holospora obtusa]ETZ07709.1 hypothetical protein P618_200097 [Holospora obtusa F1]
MKLKYALSLIFLSSQVFSSPLKSLISGNWDDPKHVRFVVKSLKLRKDQIDSGDLVKILELLTQKAKHVLEVKNFFKEYFLKKSEQFTGSFSSDCVDALEKERMFELGVEWMNIFPDTAHFAWGLLLSEVVNPSKKTQERLGFPKLFEDIVSRIKTVKESDFTKIIEVFLKFKGFLDTKTFETLGFERVNTFEESNFSAIISAICNAKQKFSLSLFERLDFYKISGESLFFEIIRTLCSSDQKMNLDHFQMDQIVHKINSLKMNSQFAKMMSTLCNAKQKKFLKIFEKLNFDKINALSEVEFFDVISSFCNANQKIDLNIFQIEQIVQKMNLSKSENQFADILYVLFNAKQKIPLKFFEKLNFDKINSLSDLNFSNVVRGFFISEQDLSLGIFKKLNFSKINELKGWMFMKCVEDFFKSRNKGLLTMVERLDFKKVNTEDSQYLEDIVSAMYLCEHKVPPNIFEQINFKDIMKHDNSLDTVALAICDSTQDAALNIFDDDGVLSFEALEYDFRRLIVGSRMCKVREKISPNVFKKFCKNFFETPDCKEMNKLNFSDSFYFVSGFCNFYKKEALNRLSEFSPELKSQILKKLIVSENLLEDVDLDFASIANFSSQEKTKELILDVLSFANIDDYAIDVLTAIKNIQGISYAKKFAKFISDEIKNRQEALIFDKDLKIQDPKEFAFLDWSALNQNFTQESLQKDRAFLVRLIRILYPNAKNKDVFHDSQIQKGIAYLDSCLQTELAPLFKGYESLMLQIVKNDLAEKMKKDLSSLVVSYFWGKDVVLSNNLKNVPEENLSFLNVIKALDWGTSGYNLFQEEISCVFEANSCEVNLKKLDEGCEKLVTDILNLVFYNQDVVKISTNFAHRPVFRTDIKNDLEKFIKHAHPSIDESSNKDDSNASPAFLVCSTFSEIVNGGSSVLNKEDFSKMNQRLRKALWELRLAYVRMEKRIFSGSIAKESVQAQTN